MKKMKEIMEDKVEKVIVSYQMVDSTCPLVTVEYGWSTYGKKYEGSSTRDNSMTQYMQSKKTMEINTNHEIVSSLKEKFAAYQSDKTIKDLVLLLFEMALLTSGFSLEETVKFAGCIHKLVKLVISIFDYDGDDYTQEVAAKEVQENKQMTNQTMHRKCQSRQWKKLINFVVSLNKEIV
ncbi:hypothetical protein RFI_21208 [Reticulomyxa filosa]|uniref:Heat shock protein 90 n=1 Tax=Reticulomyxa filosa TaxID=46433 RepID=X6MRS1_RETFI|nr:hypothetical protein RFI_21208 [Reticulomyxa filosa]|eukprot:ETO16152.1 hypothetical protein RFI_21208 [Reticulomyxa filosa]